MTNMTVPLYLAFIAAAAFLLVIPGPTVLLVIGYGLAEGRNALWALVCGVTLGDALALTGSVAGLGAVLAASAAAFTILKYSGAVYLVSLGLTMGDFLVSLWGRPAKKAMHPEAAGLPTAVGR